MLKLGFNLKSIFIWLTCAIIGLLVQGFVLVSASEFSDLTDGDRYYPEVMFLQQRGAVHGYPDGTFQAERPVNRAEVLKMVFLTLKPYYFETGPATDQVRLIGTGASTENVSAIYPDVPSDVWFAPYVAQATVDAMIKGTPDGTYEPGRTVNKAELLKIIFRNDNRDIETYVRTGPYTDVPRRSWFTRYFVYANYLNLLETDEFGNVDPAKQLTRGEVAEILYKYIKEKQKIRTGVSTYYADYFHGRGTASGEPFDMYAMTAAHKELPFNTHIRVTNKENGKYVIVRINDRGPFVAGREIDLSKAAFERISPLGRGMIKVDWQIISDYDAANDI